MLNKITVIGNVTKDAELKNVNLNGVDTPCCRFNVAVNDTKRNGEEITLYYEVTLWRNHAAKLAPYLTKGRQVYVEGSLRLNQYLDSNHNIRTALQIGNASIQLLGKSAGQPVDKKQDVDVESLVATDDDEFPFG